MLESPERLVLFSQPSPVVFEKLKSVLFPEYLKGRVFAYMASEGDNKEENSKHTPEWRQFAEGNRAKFIEIDNSKRGHEADLEADKIMSADILMISGGNTYRLLRHLRQSGLDRAIIKFWQKGNVVLSGFSAGAIVLTPSIETAKTGADEASKLGITDLTGLGVVDFEIWPHYDSSQNEEASKYRRGKQVDLKLIGSEDCLIIDK